MQIRRAMVLAGIVLECALGQTQPAVYPATGPVIKAEARLVLVDAVVSDKKGKYVHDLTAKDFRVWEDNKEQAITSFSFEADAAANSAKRTRYLVLFFDNSTISLSNQVYARRAAVKFIEANAGPDRLMAVVNYSGTLQVAQNFTANAERLKQAAGERRFSSVSPNGGVEVASLGMPSLARAERSFGVRSVLLALRNLAKDLAPISGRKSLIFLTEGFPLSDDDRPELTAVIDACNKANVAVYPIDVRGLVAVAEKPARDAAVRASSGFSGAVHSFLKLAAFTPSTSLAFWQQPGGGSGGAGGGGGMRPGGGSTGGSTGGNTGGNTGGTKVPVGGRTGTGNPGAGTVGGGRTPSTGGGGSVGKGGGTGVTAPVFRNNPAYNPMAQPRVIVPQIPRSALENQDVMYALAAGTGGFVIANTNGLLEGLQKIGSEQDEYYMLGYSPVESAADSCHTLKVKVDRPGVTVRARSGYCNTKPVDLLAGKATEKELEALVAGPAPGNATASMSLPYFYTSANTARVNVAMEIPGNAFNFEKVKGKQHTELNLLGIAYKPDGSLAARFSDTVKLDLEGKKQVEEFRGEPFHYENQFEIAAGQYTLKVAFSSGRESVGKLAMPLNVDRFDASQFAISTLALSRKAVPVSQIGLARDAALLEDRTPLVVRGVQIYPSGANRFKAEDNAVFYLELYAPLLSGQNPPQIALQVRVVDRKTGLVMQDTGLVSIADYIKAGNPVVPIGLKLFAPPLVAGSYRTEVSAKDSTGRSTAVRSADFELQ
jgi:VWFA-related protein